MIFGVGGLSLIFGGGGFFFLKMLMVNMICYGCGKLGYKNVDCFNKRRC